MVTKEGVETVNVIGDVQRAIMVSPRRRFGGERIVLLVGISWALALAPLRANAQQNYPNYWPVRKAVPSSGVGNVEIYPSSTSEDLIFDADKGTEIVADGAVVASDLLVDQHANGISKRIEVLETKLADVRTKYNAINLDDLTAADEHCKSKLGPLKIAVSDLEGNVSVANVVIPPECDGPKVAGLRREEISSINQWTCACEDEYSGDNCVTPSCDLTAFGYVVPETTASAVVSSTCGSNSGYLKADESCEYSCADGYMPNTFTATDTPRRIDCSKVSSTSVTTKAGTAANPGNVTVDSNSQLTCVTCNAAGFTDYTGVNCQFESCDLSRNGFNTAANTAVNTDDPCPSQYMIAGTDCKYNCTNDSMPSGVSTVNTPGTITCAADGGATTPAAPACTSCDAAGFLGYTGDNCKLASCDISGFQSDLNVVANTGDPCPSSPTSYMIAGTDCDYDCGSGYMPSSETAVDTTGTIRCHANDGTTTPLAPTCVTCDAAGFTGYTGVNCKQEPCLLSSLFVSGTSSDESSDPNFLAGDCPTGSYLQAGGTCAYDCAAGSMAVGVNNAGANGAVARGTLTCSSDGGITTDGSSVTVPVSTTSTQTLCQACSSVQYSGKNCGLDSCDITSVLAKTGVVNLDCHDTDSGSTYLAADANCFYNCTNSMPIAATAHDTSGVINCADTGAVTGDDGITPTSSGELCQSCADGGFPGYKGTNCEYEACDLSLLTFTGDVNFNNIDCPTTTYMEASDTCTFNCAAGYMPVGGTRGSPGQLTCSSDDGITSDDANNQLSGSVTLCTACTSQYSGQNCGLDSCPTTSVLAKTNVTNVDCDASYLAAGATCTYNCADGSMPIGATQTGQSGTISCAATGATGGITPSGTEACQSCAAFGVPGNTGVNCATAPTQGGGGAN